MLDENQPKFLKAIVGAKSCVDMWECILSRRGSNDRLITEEDDFQTFLAGVKAGSLSNSKRNNEGFDRGCGPTLSKVLWEVLETLNRSDGPQLKTQ